MPLHGVRTWKPSARQLQIMDVLEKSPTPLSPAAIGEACGQLKGATASKWTYHSLKMLIKKGKVKRTGPGKYQLNTNKKLDEGVEE